MPKLFITLLSGLCLLTLHAAGAQTLNNRNALPEIGIVAANTMSIQDEVSIGDVFFAQMQGQGAVLGDPVVQEYIQNLGNQMVIHAENTKFPFTFFVVNNPDFNAFAFLGGYVGIHTGLIFHAQNEAQLASVVAHEIAHVTQRHIVRGMAAQEKSSPLQIASLIGGAILMMAAPQAGIATIYAGQAGAIQNRINYTRNNEQEADRIGIRILAQSGYNPMEAAGFFETMTEMKRWGSTPPAFLMTHPVSVDRVADAKNRAQNMVYRPKEDDGYFDLIKARILGRYFYSAAHNITLFEKQLQEQQGNLTAVKYGLAIAYMRAERYRDAMPLLEELLAQAPNNYAFLDAITDVYIELQQYSQAERLLLPFIENIPNNPVFTLNIANLYIYQGNFDKAEQLLKDFVMVHPDNRLGWQLLTEAHAKQEDYLLMHQAKAEMFNVLGAYQMGVNELQFAINFAQSHLTKQRLRARMQQFRANNERMKQLLKSL